MKRRLLSSVIIFVFVAVSLFAQSNEHKQILVFRKSGITNIFYSDKLSKIELSKFDSDSVEHNEIVSQVFFRNDDTSVVIPIADIDSVAFGSRNTVRAKNNVRRLTDSEADAIEMFDDTKLQYKEGTASSLIVKAGEKVYYDKITDVLPYGLCASVKSVGTWDGVTVATIDYIEPEDMFDKYFLSGDDIPIKSRALVEDDDFDFKMANFDLPEIELDGIKATGNVKLTSGIKASDVVFDLQNHYYHAVITVFISPELKFSCETAEGTDKSFVTNPMPLRFRLPAAMGAIALTTEIGGFIDFKVEAGVSYEYKSEYKAVFEWERRNGQNTFTKPVFTQNPIGDMEQKTECYLDGELFLGALADIGIGVLFDRIGAGAQIKVGPSLQAEFNLGVLNELSATYSEELFGKASLSLSAKLAMETYTYRLTNWLFGRPDRTKLPFEVEIPVEIGTLDLFPEFHSRSTVGRERQSFIHSANRARAIDVATYSEKSVQTPVEIGFEMANSKTDETIKQLWDAQNSDILQPKSTETQSFNAEFLLRNELNNINPDEVVVRPVFKYRDKVIKAAPVSPITGMFVSPIIYHGNRNQKYVVSGQSVVNQINIDQTTFIEGNILPVVELNNKYGGKQTVKTIEFYEDDVPSSSGIPKTSLIGTWTGNVMGENIVLTFTDDTTGTCGSVPFTYKVNTPQKGGVSIKMEDGATITFYVLALDSSTMTIIPQASKKQYTLTR